MWFEPNGSIKGESQDKLLQGKGAFQLQEFTIKAENATNIGSATGGGGGAGKVKFDRLSIKKFSDSATTGFFLALSLGEHFTDAFIELRQNMVPYLVFNFKMCLISEIETSQSGDDEAEDSIVIDYGAVVITYFKQYEDGSLKQDQQAMWSRVYNDASDQVKVV
jgi:type VI secretion system secreted protein Hcp